MGDYTKLIVNCSVKKTENTEELEAEIRDRVGLCTSAYHCGGELLKISNDWHHRTDITLVTQCKYSRGIDEFLQWLSPQIIDGFGDEEYYAIVVTEYGGFSTFSKTKDRKYYKSEEE